MALPALEQAKSAGLLSPELAASIRRVKGVRRLGVRVGNWLTAEQGQRLLEACSADSLRGKRDHAMLAMLIGCGLRRAEVLNLTMQSIQLRKEHWVIADLVGKGGHIRTVPIPLNDICILDGRTDRGRRLRLVFQDKGNGVVRIFTGWELKPKKKKRKR